MKFALYVLLALCLSLTAQAQEGSKKRVGKIIKVKGRAYLKGPGQEVQHLTTGDKDIPIFAGQMLECVSKCELKFLVGSDPIHLSGGRYRISNLGRARKHLHDSVVVGAPSRGPMDILLSPPLKGTGMTRPESFKFRWRMLRTNEGLISISPLTISLVGCKTDERIWVEPGIDYKKGRYVSEEVRRLLKERQQPDSVESIEVVVTSASFREPQRFCFDLISAAEEQRLAAALAMWDDYDDLVRHAERARVFYQHRLYDEAAEEVDAALRLSPQTDYLLADAIMARFRLGDKDEVDALLDRLGKLSSSRGLYHRMLALTGRKKRG